MGASDRQGCTSRIQGIVNFGGKENETPVRGESQQTGLIYSPLDWTRGTNLRVEWWRRGKLQRISNQ